MQLLSRRSVVSVLSCSAWGSTTTTTTTTTSSSSSLLPSPTTRQLAEYICQWTPTSFRQAIRDTDGQPFLYRGAESNLEAQYHHHHNHNNNSIHLGPMPIPIPTTTSWIRPQQPLPDLLLLQTHGNDPRALEYFQELERRLRQLESNRAPSTTTDRRNNLTLLAMPSNGHIATSDPSEASKWGTMVVSVWPLGSHWSYVWPRHRAVFYDYSRHRPENHDDDDNDPLMINTEIQEALRQPREVLFATAGWTSTTINPIQPGTRGASSAFLAIPMDRDDDLRKELNALNYGLNGFIGIRRTPIGWW